MTQTHFLGGIKIPKLERLILPNQELRLRRVDPADHLPDEADSARYLAAADEDGEHGKPTVGRIIPVARASGRQACFWTIIGPAAPDAGIGLADEADGLEDLKTVFGGVFYQLLYRASMS